MEIFFPGYAYLEIDSLMFFPTLIISLLFIKRDYVSLIKSIAIVSPIYLFWDFLATWKGTWSFNPQYVLGIYVINLPIEEVLFFVVTPFATLLIYDFVQEKMKDKEISWAPKAITFMIPLIILSLPFTFTYSYTFIVTLYLIMALSISLILSKQMLSSRNFWVYMGLTYIPFMIFDYFLTSIPIVIYGPHSILGARVITIPVEDFIYSFSMLVLYTLFYRGIKMSMKRQ